MLRPTNEELDAVKDETTTADIRLAMARALNVTQTKAAEVLVPLVFSYDLDEKKAMLAIESFEHTFEDARKNERKAHLSFFAG